MVPKLKPGKSRSVLDGAMGVRLRPPVWISQQILSAGHLFRKYAEVGAPERLGAQPNPGFEE